MTRLNHVELFYAFVVAIGSKGSAACEPRAATCMLSAYRGWSAMARPLAGAIDYGQASATVVSCGQGRWQGQSPAGAAACKGGCLQVLLPARWPLVKATGSMGSACRVASSVGKAPARKGDRPRAVAIAPYKPPFCSFIVGPGEVQRERRDDSETHDVVAGDHDPW
ncbi:hypothetical protein GW17_00050655 [Ensete ventricosum]|nr:hypothetical protein GW17_00050655 [Ensete ventricosum]